MVLSHNAVSQGVFLFQNSIFRNVVLLHNAASQDISVLQNQVFFSKVQYSQCGSVTQCCVTEGISLSKLSIHSVVLSHNVVSQSDSQSQSALSRLSSVNMQRVDMSKESIQAKS